MPGFEFNVGLGFTDYGLEGRTTTPKKGLGDWRASQKLRDPNTHTQPIPNLDP